MSVNMEDVFNPGHTYKYAAPGPQLMNDSPAGNFRVWVPEDFPNGASTNGSYYSDLKSSPLRWAVWSMGPRPDSPESRHARAPLSAHSWYAKTGGGGVLVRMATRNGYQLNSD
jgi:hypothetical protein